MPLSSKPISFPMAFLEGGGGTILGRKEWVPHIFSPGLGRIADKTKNAFSPTGFRKGRGGTTFASKGVPPHIFIYSFPGNLCNFMPLSGEIWGITLGISRDNVVAGAIKCRRGKDLLIHRLWKGRLGIMWISQRNEKRRWKEKTKTQFMNGKCGFSLQFLAKYATITGAKRRDDGPRNGCAGRKAGYPKFFPAFSHGYPQGQGP